ncbi:MAG: glycosyltransferase family 39 protein [Acidobacteriaceae bacterium]
MAAGKTARALARTFPWWGVLLAAYAAELAAHAPLLRLPYYWDEAGYYIPAAYDFFRRGTLIPYSTLSNAHPPVPSLYLALVWRVFHFAPVVTRSAMCLVAALALTAVWRLALVTTRKQAVAAAAVLLTGLYPVVFAQSSLAHADLFAMAGTLWALVFLLEERLGWAAVCFSLAALAKETAVVTPVALAVWESWRLRPRKRSVRAVAALLAPVVPLACWYLYHWHKTGFIFGNPEYVEYNATATLMPLRILLALAHRVMHVTLHMNLFVPVAAMFACLLLPPVTEQDGTVRARITPEHQALFLVVIVTNVMLFSVLGGALLTRYLLPLYPLILLLAVNTFRRRLREWTGLVALSAAAFVVGLFVNPPYRFAPEDNLEYVTVVRLHQAAIGEIMAQVPHPVVLTAWPASDELTKPELGYVTKPVPVVAIDNFSAQEVEKAAYLPEDYNTALVFSTKYDPPHLLLSLGRKNEQLDERYFDFHRDLPPGLIARILGGNVVWREEHKGQWAAVLRFTRQPGPTEGRLGQGPASSRAR